jgi:hypothetical protein
MAKIRLLTSSEAVSTSYETRSTFITKRGCVVHYLHYIFFCLEWVIIFSHSFFLKKYLQRFTKSINFALEKFTYDFSTNNRFSI